MALSTRLDHVVINTRFSTDEARALFEGLRFTLTPRGYHTLGSINHLIMFGDHYLELIGLPHGTDRLRREILDSPAGPDGLVWRTDTPQADYDALRTAGFEVVAPQAFSRPVELHGGTRDAHFVTVRLAPGALPGGRVYYCQHLSPELVFRQEWIDHANGARSLAQLHLIAPDAVAARAAYARIGVAASNEPYGEAFALHCWTRETFATRFGALTRYAPPGQARFAALTVRATRLGEIAARARGLSLPCHENCASVRVALPEFVTLLEFIDAR